MKKSKAAVLREKAVYHSNEAPREEYLVSQINSGQMSINSYQSSQ